MMNNKIMDHINQSEVEYKAYSLDYLEEKMKDIIEYRFIPYYEIDKNNK